MSFVVFLRAVNVGGRNTFRPSLFARELAHLGAINVGAAGTFVIPGTASKATLSADLAGRLPVSADLMICSGRELVELAEAPFSSLRLEEGMRRFVSVMAARPRKPPALPLSRPSGKDWEVKVVGVSGRFALSLCRRLGRSFVDPNAVVEKNFGVRSTTRNWNTVAKIREILR